MGFRDKPGSPTARPKTAAASQTRRQPAPPPVYRPQPVPRVLQTKALASQQLVNQPQPAPATPSARRHQAAPKVVQTTNAGAVSVQPKTAHRPAAQSPHRPQPRRTVLQAKPLANQPEASVKRSPANNTAAARGIIQRTPSPAVVQAVKFYPNLHPGAVERIEPSSLFRLESFTDQYRLRKTDSHGVYVPNQLYNFVRTGEGATLLHNRYRHPSIAEGRQVLYAGEAFFNNGRLEWWSNGSGHYQPDADDAAQAALPLDNFYTYQQVIKGEHKRRKP
jgi:hypothetical protein